MLKVTVIAAAISFPLAALLSFRAVAGWRAVAALAGGVAVPWMLLVRFIHPQWADVVMGIGVAALALGCAAEMATRFGARRWVPLAAAVLTAVAALWWKGAPSFVRLPGRGPWDPGAAAVPLLVVWAIALFYVFDLSQQPARAACGLIGGFTTLTLLALQIAPRTAPYGAAVAAAQAGVVLGTKRATTAGTAVMLALVAGAFGWLADESGAWPLWTTGIAFAPLALAAIDRLLRGDAGDGSVRHWAWHLGGTVAAAVCSLAAVRLPVAGIHIAIAYLWGAITTGIVVVALAARYNQRRTRR